TLRTGSAVRTRRRTPRQGTGHSAGTRRAPGPGAGLDEARPQRLAAGRRRQFRPVRGLRADRRVLRAGEQGGARVAAGEAPSELPLAGRSRPLTPGPLEKRVELRNEFTFGLPLDKTWALLTDLEQIAPCMPGAKLEGVDGENYLGLVKVKVGPITMSYRGTAGFLERDEDKHRAVLQAEGRDTRGQGNAVALVTAELESAGESTKVTVVTELNITGRVAQFGRGALADVSTKLLGQFVERLEA